jgi:hypothetical protein
VGSEIIVQKKNNASVAKWYQNGWFCKLFYIVEIFTI